MPWVPAHLREHALGLLQGGMRTANVARAINCKVSTVRCLRQRYREIGWTADRPRSGRPHVTTSVLTRHHWQQHRLWAQTHHRWTRQDWQKVCTLERDKLVVEGPSWSGAVCHRIIRLSLLSLQAISMLCVTGKTSSSLMWYPSCRLILTRPSSMTMPPAILLVLCVISCKTGMSVFCHGQRRSRISIQFSMSGTCWIEVWAVYKLEWV
uniref:Transposase Tc1-like domain-containing protein n=1 Tax=Oncorhynchus mykiss TaxID=8022 RepID=A0A8K9V506_ONCMY